MRLSGLCSHRGDNAPLAASPLSSTRASQGDGVVGSALVSHPKVDFIGMTGSTATGSRIAQIAGEGLKRVVLELGGKDPMVVFGDADLQLAARHAVEYSFSNAGQVCSSVERVYVDKAVAREFESLVLATAQTYSAGNGLDEAFQLGPLVSDMQRQHVHQHVLAAKAAGARCLLGGELPPPTAPGYFYPPTVLADVPQLCTSTTQETFGPLIAISHFSGEEEDAITLANDSEYGLSASVYTEDVNRAARVASRICAGQVGINNWPLENAPLQCPWVGHKKSGCGFHSGLDGWRQFSGAQPLLTRRFAHHPSDSRILPSSRAPLRSTKVDHLPSWPGGASYIRVSTELGDACSWTCDHSADPEVGTR